MEKLIEEKYKTHETIIDESTNKSKDLSEFTYEIFKIKFEKLENEDIQSAYTKEYVELYLYNYKIGYILDKYPKDLKDEAINIIITNLKLRNPEHRKNRVKLEDVILEIFANGLIDLDIENKKIETAIKLAKGEISEEEADEIL